MAMGEYQIVVCEYGTRACRRSQAFLNYDIYGTADAQMMMDYFVWVLRNPERTILVDVGFSEIGAARRNRTLIMAPADIYDALEVDTRAPITVVVTHAHYDHIGNLSLFPNAQIVMSRAEYEFWTSPMGGRGQFHYLVEDAEIEHLVLANSEGRVQTFSGTLDLAPGIRLVEIGGHTPGLTVVRVQTAAGAVLLASDAVHYYEELSSDMPFAFGSDLTRVYAGFDTVKALIASGDIHHVVPGHDPDTLNHFVRVNDGPLSGIAATIG